MQQHGISNKQREENTRDLKKIQLLRASGVDVQATTGFMSEEKHKWPASPARNKTARTGYM